MWGEFTNNIFGFNVPDAVIGLQYALFYGIFFGFLFGIVRYMLLGPLERSEA
jgi:hypothetical protein